MIDWAARVDELAARLAREEGVEDRTALDLLLSSLIDCPRTPTVWLILETNWYARNCLEGWFSFGREWVPHSLARLRARYPWREIEGEINRFLETPEHRRLFIECDFERYPYFSRLTQAHFILQRTLRVRSLMKRTAEPAALVDQMVADRRRDELQAATRWITDDHARLRPVDPPEFIPPPDFLYYAELLQKLAPWYPDWGQLLKALTGLAVRRAYLYGRRQTDETDYAAMARVIQDSIPVWIAKALRILLEGQTKCLTVEARMGLEEKTRRSGHGAHLELVRLHRAHIIGYNNSSQAWYLAPAHKQGVRLALDGGAFAEARAA